jgi:ankyrin repeat protein
MNNKRLISLTVCLILATVPGISSLILADITSGTNTEAEQHFEKANELRKLADYDAAIAEYKKVISLSPKSKIAQDAQYWIGQSHFRAGQFDAALSAFQKLLDEYPASTIIPSTKLMMERVQQAKKKKSLFETVKKGDTEQVKSLISEGADVNARDENGQTPLHFAARHGHREIAILLIAHGADVNASMADDSWTPLLDAACAGHAQVVKVLLENGAKVDVGDNYGYTPLVYGLWSKDEEGIKALISAGADINKRPSENDYPPLFYAVWEGYKKGVKILIDAGANVNTEDENGYTPLHYAINQTNADVAKLFIGTGVKIPAFQNAILEGDLAKVKQLFESGMDVDTKDKFGCTPAYWALSVGQKELFEYLLNKGADVNAKTNDGCTPLHQASKAGFVDIARQLIAKGADVNAATTETGRQPLADAAGSGHEEIVRLLIAKGADVNAMFSKGRHALGDAAKAGHENVVKLLLASGAEVNLHSESRGGALHAAARFGHATILDLLIANGADVNLNAIRGTPLHRAAYGLAKGKDDKCAEMVKRLLAKGADVNAKDPQMGRTPLHVAVDRGRYKTAEVLIAAGADVNATDNDGQTPIDIALSRKLNKEIVKLLRQHGAKE